jgi:hypothetical protein
MYATQTSIPKRRREYINQPCELTIIEDEIHKFPDCMRKSLKLNRHKQKANYMRSRPKNIFESGRSDMDKLNININICKALHKEKEL